MKMIDWIERVWSFLKECEKLQTENSNLRSENSYLIQRIKEFRHKTWFPVYKENLELQEELKVAKAVIESVETFIGRFSNEKR
jgi:hypothetical protein